MEIVPLADAKAHLSDLIRRVEKQHDQVTVTRNGRASAVVVSLDEWESLHETLEILSDSEAMAELRAADEEIASGEVYSTADVLEAMRSGGKRSA